MSCSAFFYGSLMSKVVLLRVLCGAAVSDHDKALKLHSIQLRSALLKGYKRFSLIGEDYPAVVYTGDDEQDSVTGILCQGLEPKDINALDCFEGEAWDYKRVAIRAVVAMDADTTSSSSLIDTQVYLWIGDNRLLSNNEWSLDYFISSGKEQKWLDERCEFYDVDNLHITENLRNS